MNASSYSIVGGDYESGGNASRSLKDQLKKIGANPAVIRRAMIAAYEAAMNVVIHAYRGELRFQLDNGQLDVEVADEGPGIPDIEQALQPGFSTASAKARELGFGAGMGLPNIKRNSDEFTLESTVGKGTTIRLRIHLRPQALYGVGRHSVEVESENCQVCYRCLQACPTGAIRLSQGRPQILDYLCIDCTACLAACPHGTFRIAGTADVLKPRSDTVLVISPALLAQYGPQATPQHVLAAMGRLGFKEVVGTAPWEAALRDAVVAAARAKDQLWPMISPVCPAVTNLIEMRFPSLIPHLAHWESPFAAAAAALGTRSQTWVVTCPCQRTELSSRHSDAPIEFVLPAALQALTGPRLSREPAAKPAKPSPADDAPVLRVTGMASVVGLLESIENGLVGDIAVVEPWACEEGCFGSPLLTEEPALAWHRWERAGLAIAGANANALPRSQPRVPRPGLRLDTDMSKAVQKLGRIDKLTRQLPGDDCGLCGAPTCGAFAEDVVLGRASADACVRQKEPPKETP